MTTIPYAPSLDISPQASAVLKRLDSKVEDLATSVRQLEAWRSVTSPHTSNRLRAAILREVMLSVYWYQSQTTEAGFHMLGRLPKDAGKILTTLLAHKADEAEHGLWALRDYLQLGGKREIADGPPSPATFAVASVWWGLAYREEPLGYLGAEYLFEYLTAILAPEVMQSLASSNGPDQGLGFIRDHAYEDEKHTQLLRAVVARAVDHYPTCRDALMWIAGAVVSPWYIGLTPLLVMLPQYWSAIRFEEQQMLSGPLRTEYEGYQKRVGWFFPKTLRIMDWTAPS